ncbi:hypothetical protein [Bdellovibrio bacteriovorus]|uniref:hypothetical protein n=1 Tax=Bdellovibrio bacteriovorus TaxID=959 RepID=UPI0035A70BC0
MKKHVSTLLYFILGFCFVFFTGLSTTYAKPKRGEKPAPISSVNNPLEMVKPFSNLTADFYDFVLRYNGRLIPGKDLQPWITKIQNSAEDYFNSIGVQYELQMVKREDMEFQGSFIEKLSYPLFIISGVSEARESNGQFFEKVLSDSRLQSLKLVFDPFLPLWSGPIQGFFEPSSNSLYFSVTALSYRTGGLGDTLEHELLHALENENLLKGSLTLAAITLMADQRTPEVYSDFLRLDEIETHLLDIEFLTKQAPQLEENVLDKGSLKRLREERNKNLEFKKETVQRLLKNSLRYLSKLRENISTVAMNCRADDILPLRVCKTSEITGESYDKVEIRFPATTPQTDLQKMKELLDWSLQRLSLYQRAF